VVWKLLILDTITYGSRLSIIGQVGRVVEGEQVTVSGWNMVVPDGL
jgi:hypothetical protein